MTKSAVNGTRVIAGVSIIPYLYGSMMGLYLGRISMPILLAEISGGGGYEAFFFGVVVASYFALAACGGIFSVLVIWALRFPVKKRKRLLYLGLTSLVIASLLGFYYFFLMMVAAPIAGGAGLVLLAYLYAGRGVR